MIEMLLFTWQQPDQQGASLSQRVNSLEAITFWWQ